MKKVFSAAAVLAASAGYCAGDVLQANPGPANNGGSANWATFFDLEAVSAQIIVTHLTTANTGGAGAAFQVEVFVRDGTALGGPLSSGPGSSLAGWTSLGIANAVQGPTASGISELIDIPDITVDPGQIRGVALRFTVVGPRYVSGTVLTTYQDSNLKLTTGDVRSAPFTTTGSYFTPRLHVGELTYELGGPTGACCVTSGASNCVITTATGCTGLGGTYNGDGSTCATANCAPLPTGACCRNDGTCDVGTQNQCTTTGGTYAGNDVTCGAANCPPGGACCFFSTCSTLTSAACTAQGGTWLGSGSACGSCPTPYAEVGDAGDLPGTAQDVSGSGQLVGIAGTLTTGDADMFKINVCNAANFSASTVGLASFDTQLFVFRTDGTGVTFNDDNPPPGTGNTSTIGNTIMGAAGNGEYYIAISQYNKDPRGASTAGLIWANTPFNVERAPDGPAAAEPVGSWDVTTGTGGTYGILLSGACYLSAGGCYANCDGSTGSPLLTANDFQCFLNKYAANDTYANCDGSTGSPLLTANDFQCFLNKYAAGCS